MKRTKTEVIRLPNNTYYLKQKRKTNLNFLIENYTPNRGVIKIGTTTTEYFIGKKIRIKIELVEKNEK